MGINSSNGNGYHDMETNDNGHGNNGQSAKRPKPPHVILTGPQGVGKGTQGAMLVERYGYTHVESGQVFRTLMKQQGDSELAQKIKAITQKGELVPDEVTMHVMEPYLKFDEQILLDGIPRSPGQARILQQMLGTHDYLVIIMSLDKEECKRRIGERVAYSQANGIPVRNDDLDPVAVEKRLEIYEKETVEALTGSFPMNRIHFIDASADVDLVGAAIHAQIDAIMETKKNNHSKVSMK
ncbi:MAG: nucleoside monophosphate kinase [Candidatus Peribacteraceae bacterium]|nr:nucleoside monophosphate kinase [Candidatus Peribacteraceae bacterium]